MRQDYRSHRRKDFNKKMQETFPVEVQDVLQ